MILRLKSLLFLIFFISCNIYDPSSKTDNISKKSVPIEELLQSQTDLQNEFNLKIDNVIIYPNSTGEGFFLDISYKNYNINDISMLSVLSDNQLVLNEPIILESKKVDYFKRYLIEKEFIPEKNIQIIFSSINKENNINDNRILVERNLKIDTEKIALISGQISFLTKAIKQEINKSIDHYFVMPYEDFINLDNFWTTKYDLVILDYFPLKEIPKKWFEIFLKKLIEDKSSLILVSNNNQENYFRKLLPLFGIKESELILKNFKLYENQDFRSAFFYNQFPSKLFDYDNGNINKAIDWTLKKDKLVFSFYSSKSDYVENDDLILYGYSNIQNNDKKVFRAIISNDEKQVYFESQMFLNPINNYYFAKFSSLKTGLYSISIVDNENNIFSEKKLTVTENNK